MAQNGSNYTELLLGLCCIMIAVQVDCKPALTCCVVINQCIFTSLKDTDFLEEYYELLKLPQYETYPEFPAVGVAYDAIWSLALALDKVTNRVANGNDSGCGHLRGALVPLEFFDYANEKMGCILRQSIDEVEFSGVTVSKCKTISFIPN